MQSLHRGHLWDGPHDALDDDLDNALEIHKQLQKKERGLSPLQSGGVSLWEGPAHS